MSRDRYASLHHYAVPYLLTPSANSRITYIAKEALSLIDSVNVLIRAASPRTLKGVFITGYGTFENCQRTVEALRNAGYTNIESIDSASFTASESIYNIPTFKACDVGETVIVVYTMSVVFVLQKRIEGWQFVSTENHISTALADHPSACHVVFNHKDHGIDKTAIKQHFHGRTIQLHSSKETSSNLTVDFVRNRINKGNLNGYEVLPYCRYYLLIKFGVKCDVIPLMREVPPVIITKEIDVGDVPFVEIYANDLWEDSNTIVKVFKFKSPASRTVSITVNVDKTLLPQITLKTVATRDAGDKPDGLAVPKDETVKAVESVETKSDAALDFPTKNNGTKGKNSRSRRRKLARINAAKNGNPDELTIEATLPDDEVDKIGSITTLSEETSKLELNPSPKTILTFTSDNRVLIETDASYTGNRELLAYVRLEAGKLPVVGQLAFDALQTNSGSVFYDITRLLAAHFDPEHPDPSWGFKTARDENGKMILYGGNDVITFPLALFGLVVKSTLLYIQEHMEFEVSSIGIRLPAGSMIGDCELKEVSERIGVEVVIC